MSSIDACLHAFLIQYSFQNHGSPTQEVMSEVHFCQHHVHIVWEWDQQSLVPICYVHMMQAKMNMIHIRMVSCA